MTVYPAGGLERGVLTVPEVAEILRISPQTVRNEIKRGRLRCFRPGYGVRITTAQLAEYMERDGKWES